MADPLAPVDRDLHRFTHRTIRRVTEDVVDRLHFNTAVAAVMELVNECYASKDDPNIGFAAATAGSLIFPAAPHLGAEVYELTTGKRVWEEPWPLADAALVVGKTLTVVVQINGKVRDRLEVAPDTAPDELERLARESPRVLAQLNGAAIVKAIVVPGKLVNLVVR